jgi:polygalacturonase
MKFVGLLLCLALVSVASAAPATQPAQFDVRIFGASADGKTSATKQIQSAIDACATAGGGTVIVPAGQYVTGTLWMKSNVTLHLEAGATLLGSQDMDEFPFWTSKWEGPGVEKRRAALFAGEKLENVALTGRGTVDARGAMWWKLQKAKKGVEVLRPLTFRLIDSKNILIEGLTFKNSPMWTISPLACDNVTIDKITINNPPDSPNTDGINPESCRNVRISNCHVDVGDDCITIKSGKETDGRRELWPSENITITNCTLLHGHGGVVFGSEMSGSIRNVTIDNCVFIGTDRGLRFKARRGRGGVIEDIRANNIVMDGVLCPITVNLFYGPGAWQDKKVTDETPAPVDAGTPRFRRFRFSNITARRVKYAAAYMMGLPEMHVEDIACDNLSFFIDPENTDAGTPDMAPNTPKLARAGFLAQRVDRLSLRNVDISDQVGPALSITEARELILKDVIARTSSSDSPVVRLANVERASIAGCSVPSSTQQPLQILGSDTTGIRIGDNDWGAAAHPIDVANDVKPAAIREVQARDANPDAKRLSVSP